MGIKMCELKKCSKCGEEKEEEEFYWVVKDVRRRAECKKCQLAQHKEYEQTEEGRAAAAKHAKTDKRKASAAKHRKTDKFKAATAKHKKTDKYKETRVSYQKSDECKASQARKNAKRKAKKLAEPNTLIPEQWEQIKGGQDYKCAGCHEAFTEEKPATEDHIIPIGVGPGRTEENIQAFANLVIRLKGSTQWNTY